MMNKRGLSGIIATVLIILLALAAVVIIWAFISPILEKGGGGISDQSDLVSVVYVIESVQTQANPPNTLSVLLKRESGGGRASDVFPVLVVESNDRSLESFPQTGLIIEELATNSIPITLSNIQVSDVARINVYVGTTDNDGELIISPNPVDIYDISSGLPAGPGCLVDADCSGGQYCDNGVCRIQCIDNSNCNDNNMCTNDICFQDSGRNVQYCVFNNDNTNACADTLFCNGGEICNAGSCVAGTAQCTGAGQICNEVTDTCNTASSCSTNGDCDDTMPNTLDVCNSGTCSNTFEYFRVFVSSSTFTNGDLDTDDGSGIDEADATCNSLATSSGMNGNWVAWISDSSISPSNRFYQSSVGYRLTDLTTVVANNWNDLIDNSLDSPINKDQAGQTITPGSYALTGTGSDGFAFSSYHCNSWTTSDTSANSYFGAVDAIDYFWSEGNQGPCDFGLAVHLYCFEQP